MFYKKKFKKAADECEFWKNAYGQMQIKEEKARYEVNKLTLLCNWLEEKNEKLRKRDAFTFDKAEFQRLKLENAELRARLESRGTRSESKL